MTDKINRIAAFIESLPAEKGLGDCNSTLLSYTLII